MKENKLINKVLEIKDLYSFEFSDVQKEGGTCTLNTNNLNFAQINMKNYVGKEKIYNEHYDAFNVFELDVKLDVLQDVREFYEV